MSLERRHHDPESLGRVGWAVRMVGQNARWVRRQGLGRLVEEHELNPVRLTTTGVRKAIWRWRYGVAPGSAVPVFLSGVPRSGTNMMVRALAALSQVEVYNEGDRAAFRRYRLREDAVIRDLVLASRHEVVLFKPLLDGHRIASLLDGLEGTEAGRALWAYREVDGRTRSALTKFGPSALLALTEIRQGLGDHRWQAQGMSEATREMLRELDWDAMTPVDGAALMGMVRNQLFFDQGLDQRADTMVVSYDAMARDPERSMRAVCAHVGLPWHPRAAKDIDQRPLQPRSPLPMHPAVRALCEEMHARMERAAAISAERAERLQ